MSLVAIVSFRLGGPDGVSVERRSGVGTRPTGPHDVTVAGEAGRRLVQGLPSARRIPQHRELDEALEGCDLVIVENLCSLPLNPGASRRVPTCAGTANDPPPHDLPCSDRTWRTSRAPNR